LKKWLAVGIILLFIGTVIIPSTAQKINENDASTFDGKPDLTITGIIGEYYLDGATCKCVVKNIGTAPSADYELRTDFYAFFGLIHIGGSYNHGFPLINPGETKNVTCGCPYPYFGIIRIRSYISTSIPEEDYSNNRFVHSYFIMNWGYLWFFKEMPW